MASTFKQKELIHRYPVTDGYTSGTTTQEGHKECLEPEGLNGLKTTIRVIMRTGM